MADEVKQLLLQVDATVELLRRNLQDGSKYVEQFEVRAKGSVDRTNRQFEKLGDGLTSVGSAVAKVNRQIGTIDDQVRATERSVRSSFGSIKNVLLNSSTALATAFSVNRVKDAIDSYTKFTNQLKVAGLEGQSLAGTQESLFEIAQKYGVQLEALGTLYGRNAAASKELGLSQADQLKFVQGTAAALKISGQSTEEARGALLQLSQAIGGTMIQSQEYNSLIDGARPLLQAVANGSDRWAGSVTKLTADVKAAKVETKDFVQAALIGFGKAGGTFDQAEKAALTIGGAFTVLDNALSKYISESSAGIPMSMSRTLRLQRRRSATAWRCDRSLGRLVGLRDQFRMLGEVFGGCFIQLGRLLFAIFLRPRGRERVVPDFAQALESHGDARLQVDVHRAMVAGQLVHRGHDGHGIAIAQLEQVEVLAPADGLHDAAGARARESRRSISGPRSRTSVAPAKS